MSGYTWTLPSVTGGTTGAAGTAQRALNEVLGKDIFFDGDMHVIPAGDYLLVEGIDAMRQAIYRRLITKPGEYKRNPEYGVGVQLYIKRRRTSSVINELRGRIIDQLSLDRRIEEVIAAAVEYIDDGIQLALKVRVAGQTLKFQPFQFTEKALTGV